MALFWCYLIQLQQAYFKRLQTLRRAHSMLMLTSDGSPFMEPSTYPVQLENAQVQDLPGPFAKPSGLPLQNFWVLPHDCGHLSPPANHELLEDRTTSLMAIFLALSTVDTCFWVGYSEPPAKQVFALELECMAQRKLLIISCMKNWCVSVTEGGGDARELWAT